MFKVIPGFVDEDYCKVFTVYALNERLERFKPYSKKKHETPGPDTHGRYKDHFAEASLKAFLPRVQRYFGDKEIYPSYSYYIVYENGARLNKHIDKEVCEISLTIPTGYLYSDSYQGSVWPLYIDDDVPIKLNIGDAFLYTQDPKKHVHWRLPFEGIYQVQLLLHYVTGSNTKSPVPIKKLLQDA